MKPLGHSSVIASAGAALRRVAAFQNGPQGDDASPTHYQCDCGHGETDPPVDPWRRGFTRRRLLQGGGMILAAPLAQQLVTTRLAFAQTPGATNAIVMVNCRGGYAGHNFMVPHGDADYYNLMGNLAVPQNQLWGADAMFGWNSALQSLEPFWNQGVLAGIQAVAQDQPNYSHFGATEEGERGSTSNVGTGHTNRLLERLGLVGTAATPFQAAQFGGRLPISLQGPAPALTLSNGVENFRLNAENSGGLSTALAALYQAARPEDTAVRTALDALQTAAQIAAEDYQPATPYPDSGFATALQEIARVIKAGVGLKVACVDIGGWDTHSGMDDGSNPNGSFNNHVRDLADPIAAFATDLGDLLGSTTIVSWTEFGRRPYKNDSNGTDHGYGNAMMVLGGGVTGGFHGTWPGLSEAAREDYDGNIAKTSDYRDVIGGVYKRIGLADPNLVFAEPDYSYTELGIVA